MTVSGQVRFHESLQILMEDINDVGQHPDNPSSGDIDAIATSIEVVGMYRPVYAQRSTGHIVAGNTTYAACLSLDATQIPVVWLDIDDETALRILLGDNQLARLALLDQGLLGPLLEQLMESDLALLGTGYSSSALPELENQPLSVTHTVMVTLTGEEMAQWFDIPGEDDRHRLFWLLDRR
jgi:ParB-like chromosome segregation protein Spo0J